MSTIVTRAGKGSPLTNNEVDANFNNLNSTKLESSAVGTLSTQNANSVAVTGGAIDNTTVGSTTPAAGSFTTLNSSGATQLGGNGAVTVAAGTTAQRPTGVTGMFRYNLTTPGFEGFNGTSWGAIGGGSNITTLGLYENSNTISANYTIGTGNNAVSAGPITINSGVTVTVPSGSNWVIV